MTQEQYIRAVQINERIGELERVKKGIEKTRCHRLWYASRTDSIGSDWRLTPEWLMKCISGILDKHDTMIRAEIDEEIEKLKAEIETL